MSISQQNSIINLFRRRAVGVGASIGMAHGASITHEGGHGKTLGEQMKCKTRREEGQKQAIHCIAKSLIPFL
jgi:hypothetical protein